MVPKYSSARDSGVASATGKSDLQMLRRISAYLVQMRENTDQKKLRSWTIFRQCT